MAKQKQDWSQFTRRIILNRPMQEVYSAWSIPKNLTQWFLESTEYTAAKGELHPKESPIVEGLHYHWKWHNWDTIEEGKVLQANGTDKIGFTFGEKSNVFLELTELNKGTEITLLQKDIPTDNESKMNIYIGCSNAWTFWLTNLKAWLEQGITLNAKGLDKSELTALVNS